MNWQQNAADVLQKYEHVTDSAILQLADELEQTAMNFIAETPSLLGCPSLNLKIDEARGK